MYDRNIGTVVDSNKFDAFRTRLTNNFCNGSLPSKSVGNGTGYFGNDSMHQPPVVIEHFKDRGYDGLRLTVQNPHPKAVDDHIPERVRILMRASDIPRNSVNNHPHIATYEIVRSKKW